MKTAVFAVVTLVAAGAAAQVPVNVGTFHGSQCKTNSNNVLLTDNYARNVSFDPAILYCEITRVQEFSPFSSWYVFARAWSGGFGNIEMKICRTLGTESGPPTCGTPVKSAAGGGIRAQIPSPDASTPRNDVTYFMKVELPFGAKLGWYQEFFVP